MRVLLGQAGAVLCFWVSGIRRHVSCLVLDAVCLQALDHLGFGIFRDPSLFVFLDSEGSRRQRALAA